MSIARGCPFNCAFCEIKQLWGKTCRAFSPIESWKKLNHMMTNYGTKGIYFINDNFTIRKKETAELCALIRKSKLDIEWVCDTRADLISRELLKEMKAAGCKTIWFGGESGSPRILEKAQQRCYPRANGTCAEDVQGRGNPDRLLIPSGNTWRNSRRHGSHLQVREEARS